MSVKRLMRYKDYYGQVELDPDAGLLHGEVIGTRDVVTFQGRSVDELKQAFQDSVEDYLEFCAELGHKPEKSYSGTLSLRLDPDLHRDVALLSYASGAASINAFIIDTLKKATAKTTRIE